MSKQWKVVCERGFVDINTETEVWIVVNANTQREAEDMAINYLHHRSIFPVKVVSCEEFIKIKEVRKYRKLPVEIEAIRFTRKNYDDVLEFTEGKACDLRFDIRPNGKCTCIIPTLEGDHIATEGDYIIKGVHGEFYPCKPDIFWKTYEEV